MLQAQVPLPEGLFRDVDRSGRVPLYFQISSRIEGAILSGALPAGACLENEMVLGRRLGLSRPTIRHAIQELVNKGLLVKSPGIGTKVVHGQVARNGALASLFDDLSKSGKRPSSRVLTHEIAPATVTVAEALGVRVGSAVFHLRRLRLANGAPFAVLENYLPETFAQLRAEQFEQNGLYGLMRALGVTIRVAKQMIGARQASANESNLLGTKPGGPVLSVTRTSYDTNGKAVEVGHHSYRPELYSFELTLVDKQ